MKREREEKERMIHDDITTIRELERKEQSRGQKSQRYLEEKQDSEKGERKKNEREEETEEQKEEWLSQSACESDVSQSGTVSRANGYSAAGW